MLVTTDNFNGIISLAAIFQTGNERIDINGKEQVKDMITKYEQEYYLKMFGVELYNYLDNYSGDDDTILSIISYLKEATACYIYMAILIERKSSYNGESIISGRSEGNPSQPMEEKMAEVHNRMVDCNRKVINVFYNSQMDLWNEKKCYISKSLLEYSIC